MRRHFITLVFLSAFALLASACGGGGEADFFDAVPNAVDNAIDDAATANPDSVASDDQVGVDQASIEPAGPITGPIDLAAAFGFGMLVMDPTTGAVTELATDLATTVFDRSAAPVVTDEAVYVLGARLRPDTTFSSDINLLRVDRSTGEFESLVDLGFDRENDESNDVNHFRIEGAGGGSVFVTISDSAGETVWQRFDATTGAELATFPTPSYDLVSDGGSCSGSLQPRVTPDGRLLGEISGLPVFVDGNTGAIEPSVRVEACDFNLELADVIADPVELDAFSSYLDGVPVEWSGLDPFFWPELTNRNNVEDSAVVGDGSDVWWVFEGSQNTENFEELTPARALLMGVVQYDTAAEEVVGLFPLGEYAGEFLDPDESDFDISRPQFDLQWEAGHLVMVDRRETSPTLILDPSTGEISEIVYELGAGNDFVTARLAPTVPGEVWVDVTRSTIVSDDDDGRFSTGMGFAERIDPVAGEVVDSFGWDGSGS